MSKNLRMIVMIAGGFLYSWESWALECQWWQTKVKSATISQHQRQGHTISKHPRQEHCRERWIGADSYINQFKNDQIQGWPNKSELFKKWSRSETKTLLELFPKLPQWAKVEQYTFRRANKSIHQGNPATSELTKKTILLYDTFFTYKDKLGAIGHEVSHFLYPDLSPTELVEFSDLSGWDLEVKDDKVYVLPPKNPILPDSVHSKEEDFTNHMEIYISNPALLRGKNPKIFNFFSRRYPL